MTSPRCSYCGSSFTPSRYHPQQAVCSAPACQRRRRTEYHRQKLQADPLYRLIVRDSRQKWREAHPDYMRAYRARRQSAQNDEPMTAQSLIERLACAAKNNLAVELKHCAATVWLLCPQEQRVENTLASAQVIVIECLRPPKQKAPCVKNIALANRGRETYNGS